jgi:hypothetical protein
MAFNTRIFFIDFYFYQFQYQRIVIICRLASETKETQLIFGSWGVRAKQPWTIEIVEYMVVVLSCFGFDMTIIMTIINKEFNS